MLTPYPANLGENLGVRVYQEVCKALQTVGLEYGRFCVELWINNGEITLGEIQAGPGGMQISWLSELLTGIDLYGVQIDDQNNNVSPFPSARPNNHFKFGKAAAIVYFQPKAEQVVQIGVTDNVQQNVNCIKLRCPLQIGDYIPPTRSWKDVERNGYVILIGKSTKDSRFLSQEIQRKLEIITH